MRTALRRRSVALAAFVVILAGCTSEQEPSDDGGGATGEADADGDEVTDDAGEGTDADAGEAVVEPSGRLQLAGFRDDNPRGISVEVTSVEVDDGGHVILGFEAVHVAPGSFADMAGFVVAIVDDLGNSYFVDRPEGRTAFRLQKDHRFTGTLAFHGPIDPEARRITLVINQNDVSERVDGASHGAPGRTPRFVVADIPLPGVGLEDEASNPDALGVLESRTIEVGEEFVSDDNPDVTVTVVRVELDGRTVEIDLEIANRSGGEVLMLRRRPTLRDGTGQRLQFVSSQSDERDERELVLGPGDEASARFGFRGAPAAGSDELRLMINPQPSGSSRVPMYEILLPLPAADQ